MRVVPGCQRDQNAWGFLQAAIVCFGQSRSSTSALWMRGWFVEPAARSLLTKASVRESRTSEVRPPCTCIAEGWYDAGRRRPHPETTNDRGLAAPSFVLGSTSDSLREPAGNYACALRHAKWRAGRKARLLLRGRGHERFRKQRINDQRTRVTQLERQVRLSSGLLRGGALAT